MAFLEWSKIDADNFELYVYDRFTNQFSLPQIDSPDTYVGGGQIIVRDNFIIQSKKFNYLEQGQTTNFGYCDLLVNSTTDGAFSMNVYIEYAR